MLFLTFLKATRMDGFYLWHCQPLYHNVNLIFFTWPCCIPSRLTGLANLPAAYLGIATGLPFVSTGLGNLAVEWGGVWQKLVAKAKSMQAPANSDIGL